MEADASCKKWTEGRGPLWPRKGLGARRPQAHSQETPGWFWQNQIKAPIEEKKYLFIEEKEISFRPMPAGLGIVSVPQRTSWLPVSEVSLDEALSHCVNRAKKEQLDEKQRAQAMGPPAPLSYYCSSFAFEWELSPFAAHFLLGLELANGVVKNLQSWDLTKDGCYGNNGSCIVSKISSGPEPAGRRRGHLVGHATSAGAHVPPCGFPQIPLFLAVCSLA